MDKIRAETRGFCQIVPVFAEKCAAGEKRTRLGGVFGA